jgi:hypothetical protein
LLRGGATPSGDGAAFDNDFTYATSCRRPSSLIRPWNVGMIG